MAPLFFLLLFSSTTLSSAATQLFLPLTHTLTHTQGPTHHLLKSSSLRSSTRTRHHHPHHRKQAQISLPLSSGSDYTLTLSLSPTTSVNLYMDTGSDLVWFPCSPFQCILCEGKDNANANSPSPPPPNSHPVSCFDSSCSAAHSTASTSDLCAIANCPLSDIETSSCPPSASLCPRFYYAYGDGSLTALLRRGPLSLSSSSSSLSFPNFTFACAHSALAEPVGVAGFGPGLLSLPNQLASLSPSLAARFSYCLVSHSFQSHRLALPSPLILGRTNDLIEPETPFVYTPILRNPKYPYFYSVGLVAVSVGTKRIEAKRSLREVDGDGNGGMVVDSGTTFTMLPSELYKELSVEFGRRMEGMERAVEVEGETGLSPCFYYEGRNGSRSVPGLGLHFGGGARVELPKRNYFMGFERGGKRVGCLMLMDLGSGSDGGPAGTLGNFQQQGFEVVYDLEEGRVGFARRRCAALWDALSRG